MTKPDKVLMVITTTVEIELTPEQREQPPEQIVQEFTQGYVDDPVPYEEDATSVYVEMHLQANGINFARHTFNLEEKL